MPFPLCVLESHLSLPHLSSLPSFPSLTLTLTSFSPRPPPQQPVPFCPFPAPFPALNPSDLHLSHGIWVMPDLFWPLQLNTQISHTLVSPHTSHRQNTPSGTYPECRNLEFQVHKIHTKKGCSQIKTSSALGNYYITCMGVCGFIKEWYYSYFKRCF